MAVSYVTSVKPWLLGNGLFPTLKVDAHLPGQKGFVSGIFFQMYFKVFLHALAFVFTKIGK